MYLDVYVTRILKTYIFASIKIRHLLWCFARLVKMHSIQVYNAITQDDKEIKPKRMEPNGLRLRRFARLVKMHSKIKRMEPNDQESLLDLHQNAWNPMVLSSPILVHSWRCPKCWRSNEEWLDPIQKNQATTKTIQINTEYEPNNETKPLTFSSKHI